MNILKTSTDQQISGTCWGGGGGGGGGKPQSKSQNLLKQLSFTTSDRLASRQRNLNAEHEL